MLGNGRLEYQHQAAEAAERLVDADIKIMVDDSGNGAVRDALRNAHPDWVHVQHPHNRGMAAGVRSVFSTALSAGADYVVHVEDDMLLIDAPPVDVAIKALEAHQHVAQILFQRQPLSPDELATGSVLGAFRKLDPAGIMHDGWFEHRVIFSLNPCVIPRHIIERYPWPEGPIGVGNEAGMTAQLLASGHTFGCAEGRYVTHLGETRATQWQL